jgi:hypothetical protein
MILSPLFVDFQLRRWKFLESGEILFRTSISQFEISRISMSELARKSLK